MVNPAKLALAASISGTLSAPVTSPTAGTEVSYNGTDTALGFSGFNTTGGFELGSENDERSSSKTSGSRSHTHTTKPKTPKKPPSHKPSPDKSSSGYSLFVDDETELYAGPTTQGNTIISRGTLCEDGLWEHNLKANKRLNETFYIQRGDEAAVCSLTDPSVPSGGNEYDFGLDTTDSNWQNFSDSASGISLQCRPVLLQNAETGDSSSLVPSAVTLGVITGLAAGMGYA